MVFEASTTPRKVTFQPALSDQEYETLCHANSDLPLERTKEGIVVVNAPAKFDTSDGNSEVVSQLRVWWKKHKHGSVIDPDAGIFLPDESSLSPDAAFVTAEQMATVRKEDRQHFLKFVPAFVLELRSKSDTLKASKAKMATWMANGAQLGWLLDPQTRTVWIFTPEGKPVQEPGHHVHGTGPVDGFVLGATEVWDCYR